MGLFNFGSSKKNEMNWHRLNSMEDLDAAVKLSFEKPVMLFKHSTRCSISSMALNRTESGWNLSEDKVVPYYLDLIAHRDVSDAIADKLNVFHQSPQMILVKNGEAVMDASHNEIRVELVKKAL